PGLGFEWAMANLSQLRRALAGLWPACKDDLTLEMAFGLDVAGQKFKPEIAGKVEAQHTEANESMADVFDEVDVVVCATNPDVALPAEIGISTRGGDVQGGPENNGLLTIPANTGGNPPR